MSSFFSLNAFRGINGLSGDHILIRLEFWHRSQWKLVGSIWPSRIYSTEILWFYIRSGVKSRNTEILKCHFKIFRRISQRKRKRKETETYSMKKISQIIVGTPNAKGKKNHYRSLNPRRPKTHPIISYKTEERKIRNYSNRRRTKNSKKSSQKKENS